MGGGAERRLSAHSEMFTRMSMDAPMKRAGRPTTIIGLLRFKAGLDAGKFRRLISERIVNNIPRFRSTMVRTRWGVVCREAPADALDMAYHVVEEASGGWGPDQLDEFVTRLYLEDKDPSRPMWRFHILNGLRGDRHYLVTNIDHGICDGASLVALMDLVVDEPFTKGVQRTLSQVRLPPSVALRAMSMIEGTLFALLAPHIPGDPAHSLKLPLGSPLVDRKRTAVTEGVPLNQVKEIRLKFPGSTVNDVFAAVLGMCLRRFYEHHRDMKILRSSGVRALVPVSHRKPGSHVLENFGNRIRTRLVRFDMRHKNRCDAVWDIVAQTDMDRFSPQGSIEQFLTAVLVTCLPSFLLIKVMVLMNGKTTFVLSNVAGPPHRVKIGGQEVSHMMFYGCGPVPLYAGILTYDGKVEFCLVADESLPDPARIGKYWREEMKALHEEASTFSGTVPRPRMTLAGFLYMLFLLSVPVAVVAAVWSLVSA